eukprot:3365334-Alexandrium_andersonii.AAC.1
MCWRANVRGSRVTCKGPLHNAGIVRSSRGIAREPSKGIRCGVPLTSAGGGRKFEEDVFLDVGRWLSGFGRVHWHPHRAQHHKRDWPYGERGLPKEAARVAGGGPPPPIQGVSNLKQHGAAS